MKPLFDYRNWLKEIREDENRREKIRRTGQDGLGPFNIETRKEMLERLLQIEKEIKIELISMSELAAIQYQWNYDGKFRYQVADIYEKIKGEKAMIPKDKILERRQEEFKILEEVCNKYTVNSDHIKELMELERANLSFLRRPSIYEEMKRKIERFVKQNQANSLK